MRSRPSRALSRIPRDRTKIIRTTKIIRITRTIRMSTSRGMTSSRASVRRNIMRTGSSRMNSRASSISVRQRISRARITGRVSARSRMNSRVGITSGGSVHSRARRQMMTAPPRVSARSGSISRLAWTGRTSSRMRARSTRLRRQTQKIERTKKTAFQQISRNAVFVLK